MTAGKYVHGAFLVVTRALGIVTLYRKFLFGGARFSFNLCHSEEANADEESVPSVKSTDSSTRLRLAQNDTEDR